MAMLALYLLSLCVRLSVLYRNDWTNRTGIWHGGFLSPIPHCVIRKLGHVQTLVRRKFRRDNSIALSTTRPSSVVVADSRVCWRHLYHNRRVVAVCYTSVNCNPLTPFDLWWICRTTCFYSRQDFDWHSASRGPSAVVVTFFNHDFVNCKATCTLIWRLKIYEIKYNISLNDVHT